MSLSPIHVIISNLPKENSYLQFFKDFAPIILTIIGWIFIYFSNNTLQKKKLKLDIQVKCTEEAIKLLTILTHNLLWLNSYIDIFSNYIKHNYLPNNKRDFFDSFKKDLNEFNSFEFLYYFQARIKIFHKLENEKNNLVHDFDNVFKLITELYEDMLFWFPDINTEIRMNNSDKELLFDKIEKYKNYSNVLVNDILELQAHLQNEFLSDFFDFKVPNTDKNNKQFNTKESKQQNKTL